MFPKCRFNLDRIGPGQEGGAVVHSPGDELMQTLLNLGTKARRRRTRARRAGFKSAVLLSPTSHRMAKSKSRGAERKYLTAARRALYNRLPAHVVGFGEGNLHTMRTLGCAVWIYKDERFQQRQGWGRRRVAKNVKFLRKPRSLSKIVITWRTAGKLAEARTTLLW